MSQAPEQLTPALPAVTVTVAGTGAPDAAPEAAPQPWRDPSLPPAQRAADLLARMTLAEKLAQLSSVWLSEPPGDAGGVAPLQGEFTADVPPFAELISAGLGQLTRVYGTRPVTPAEGAAQLAALQDQIRARSRFRIPAIAHEECLTGLNAWGATIFPTPLAWGAAFDPELVAQMAAAIGAGMRALGVHQGLAPVLDVARDPRWGRVEETIGADPYLAGTVGAAYVRGLESAGIIATLKHFVGYSGSADGRNHAPVSVGPREFADVFLPPFEMALREGGARSVMASYAAVDGVPPHASRALLTGLLREQLGFAGTVVADYFGISFLEASQGVAGSPAQAGALALAAGVDTELPNGRCYGKPLEAAVRAGDVAEELVDRAAGRVLAQKIELGLLEECAAVAPAAAAAEIDLDPPAQRELARQLAEESVVLLANDAGALPLRPDARVAVIGPLADDPMAYFGCYTFPRHVGHAHPGTPVGVPVTPLAAALAAELPQASIEHAPGCAVRGGDRSQFAAATELAEAADVVVAVLGDEAGLFGRGTSGEGCDAADLRLPGLQGELLAALAATGTPVVLVLITGRPYALGPVAGQLAAAVQAFFPGQEGGGAIAGVLSGRVVPSGKLPAELPAGVSVNRFAYLAPGLGAASEVSADDPTPLFPFGHGLSYTTFSYSQLSVRPAGGGVSQPGGRARIGTDGVAEIACTVRNDGPVAGAEVVQLYLRDPVARVVRPVRALAGYARVPLAPGESRRVVFSVHADRTSFAGLDGRRVVEAGLIEVDLGSSSADLRLHGEFELAGPDRVTGPDRVLSTPVMVLPA